MKAKKIISLALAFMLTLALVFVPATAQESESEPIQDVDVEEETADSAEIEIPDFPSLYISSELDPFKTEQSLWHDGTATLTSTEESFAFSFEDLSVRLRGRGNSTWVLGPEKRPLRLRFSEPREMLGSGHAARDWVLLANLFDPSLLRNYSALYLANLMDGMDWAPFSRFVHLYVNDEYWGVYQLADERDAGPGRAQLTFDPDPDSSDFFIEMDGPPADYIADGNIEDEDFFVANGKAFDIRFPSSGDWDGHLESVRDFMRDVYEIAQSRNYEAILSVIDMPSFIDFYLVQEFFKNIDIASRSVFYQIKGAGEDRRLYFGPVWDFDRSAGNTIDDWTEPTRIFAGERNFLFKELLVVPEVFILVAERWNEIKDNQIAQMIEHVAETAHDYKASFERNFERHDHILGADPGPKWFTDLPLPQSTRSIDTFEGQAEFLLNWFEGRVEWLSNYFDPQMRLLKDILQPDESRIGEPLGDVLYSDIVAYINGHAIPANNINGNTYVVVEDLMKYGFDVSWGNPAKTLKINGWDKNREFEPILAELESESEEEPIASGTFKYNYLYTDVKTYVSGRLVESFNIDGKTLIHFDSLKEYGKVEWDENARELRLVIE